jgi:DNA-binding beta-propeller fold protein YncE
LVANSGDGTLSRVRTDGSDSRAITVGERPVAISSNPDEVWVTNAGSNTVSRIDARSGQVSGELETEDTPSAIFLGPGRAFVANAGSGTVSEWYVPSGEPRRAPFAAGADTRGVAVVPPAVWAANAGEDTVVRLEHGLETNRVAVGDTPVAAATGSGAVWVANSGDDTVSRIDISNPDVPPKSIPVGDEPVAIAVGEGSVWVAHAGDNSVWRLVDSGGGGTVGEPIKLDGEPAGIAIGEGSAWVTLADRDEVTRVEP